MRVLVLGGKGMLGHKLVQMLQDPFDVFCTTRGDSRELAPFGFYCPDRVSGKVEATDFPSVERAFEIAKPQAVINCIGIVKQQPLAKCPRACIEVNALFPHRLSELCNKKSARLVHISTDCVFRGDKGGYKEDDPTDAEDLYGRTKALGEVSNSVTLRTSIIGREIGHGFGLVEWLLSRRGKSANGYPKAFFSGLTTHELSRVITDVLLNHPTLEGIVQVSSEPIDKYTLLGLLDDSFNSGIPLGKSDEIQIDRTLDSTHFRTYTGWQPPSWSDMVAELAADPTPYDSWRNA